jgi:hypothetical protein
MSDAAIRAALEAAEDALLRHLWHHDAGYDQAELTAKRIAKIRAYGVESAWNIRSRGAAAAVAAFLRALPACDVMMPQNPDPRATDPGGPHSTQTLAAAVERAAREAADE